MLFRIVIFWSLVWGPSLALPQYETVNVNVSTPVSNTRLNLTLADYKLSAFNGMQTTLTHGFYQTTCGSNLSFHYIDPAVWASATGTASKPILLLAHGYPESSYIWRALTQSLSERVPLFVPDVRLPIHYPVNVRFLADCFQATWLWTLVPMRQRI